MRDEGGEKNENTDEPEPCMSTVLNFDLLLLASVHKLNNETTECYNHSSVLLAGGIIIW